jgi:hypothetical protein
MGGAARADRSFTAGERAICLDRFLVFWESGYMKTTLEIPTDLYRETKAKAAMEGRKVTDLVTEGLRLVMRVTRSASARAPSAYDLLRGGRGCVNSGVRDLATHPRHMEGFGRE